MITTLVVSTIMATQTPRPIEPRVPVADNIAAVQAAERYAVQVGVEPQPVAFGDEVNLVITITRPRDEQLLLPDDITGSDELPRAPQPPQRQVQLLDGELSQETLRIPFLALGLDKLSTPALSLPIGSTTLSIAAQPVRVTPIDLPEFADAGPEGAKPTLDGHADVLLYAVEDWRPLVILSWVVAAAVAWLLLWWSLRRRRARVGAVIMPPPPPRPAHELALARLEALLQSGLLTRAECQPFVTQLMDDVLRGYVTDRFAMAAGARTTRELVSELLGLSQTGDVAVDVPMVEGLLSDADVVKFAQGNVSVTRATEMANRVRGFITATIPAVPPVSP
jgi:hypothetical protein